MQKARRYKDAKLNLAVEELNKYRELKSRLRYLNNKKEEFEQQYSEIKAVTYDGIKVAGGEYRNRIEDVAIRREDLNLEINRMQVEAERQMLYIQVRLNALVSFSIIQLFSLLYTVLSVLTDNSEISLQL